MMFKVILEGDRIYRTAVGYVAVPRTQNRLMLLITSDLLFDPLSDLTAVL
jgi:hypothetical protein